MTHPDRPYPTGPYQPTVDLDSEAWQDSNPVAMGDGDRPYNSGNEWGCGLALAMLAALTALTGVGLGALALVGALVWSVVA